MRFNIQQRKALHATYAYMQHYSSGTGFVKPFGNEIKERKKNMRVNVLKRKHVMNFEF